MVLENETYSIAIEVNSTFTLQSTDNFSYDKTFNPNKFSRNDYTKAFSITITTSYNEKRIALIGDIFSYVDNCSILEDNTLIVLMNTAMIVIDLDLIEIQLHTIFSNFGCYFSIHRFVDGYIVNGELEVLKVNRNLEVDWRFSGQDIFASIDEFIQPFVIQDNFIKLIDFSGNHYLIDKDGCEVSSM